MRKVRSSLNKWKLNDCLASDWGFSDTLVVKDTSFDGLGLVSLEKVEGVGKIVVSFGQSWDIWDEMISSPNGSKCFHEAVII